MVSFIAEFFSKKLMKEPITIHPFEINYWFHSEVKKSRQGTTTVPIPNLCYYLCGKETQDVNIYSLDSS